MNNNVLDDSHVYGIVPYRNTHEGIQILLVQQAKGGWGFPKGHQEEGETPKETAVRECYEETNLKAVFSTEEPVSFSETYPYVNQGNTFFKNVTYWLCEMGEGEPIAEGKEIINAKWVLLKDAESYISYPSRKMLLENICTTLASLQ